MRLLPMMIKRHIKELEVPVIGMGTASTFDVETCKAVERRKVILNSCMEHGANFIDTSPMYKRSEEVIGRAINGARNKFILATKVWAVGRDIGKKQIQRSFDLLNTSYIEVFQIHNLVDWKTHLPFLEELKEIGRINQIGLTHYSHEALPEMATIMETGRIDCIQISYNVMEREVEETILPLAQHMNMGVIVMRPVGHGLLIDRLVETPDISPLKEFGIQTWGQALMTWLISNPAVTCVIPATTKPSRIKENAAVGNISLPKELNDYILQEATRCLKPGNYRLFS